MSDEKQKIEVEVGFNSCFYFMLGFTAMGLFGIASALREIAKALL